MFLDMNLVIIDLRLHAPRLYDMPILISLKYINTLKYMFFVDQKYNEIS